MKQEDIRLSRDLASLVSVLRRIRACPEYQVGHGCLMDFLGVVGMMLSTYSEALLMGKDADVWVFGELGVGDGVRSASQTGNDGVPEWEARDGSAFVATPSVGVGGDA